MLAERKSSPIYSPHSKAYVPDAVHVFTTRDPDEAARWSRELAAGRTP